MRQPETPCDQAPRCYSETGMRSAIPSNSTKANKQVIAVRNLTVFYDGLCPLCNREISHYRKLAAKATIDWVDIHSPNADLNRYGLALDSAMARLHAIDSTGQWHTGAFAFAEIWSKLPYYRTLSRVLRTCRLLPLTDKIYSRFAAWRLRRRCTSSHCKMKGHDKRSFFWRGK